MDIDTIIVGAGVVGLAVARACAQSGRQVLIVERHPHIGEEVSSRNSEVIHAGIYYPKNSLKAQLCVAGSAALYQYCETHSVPFQRLGKLIVAGQESQLDALQTLKEKAQVNGVNDLRFVEQDELLEMEPALSAVAALHSPSTGIIDSHQLMLSLLGDAENAAAVIALSANVQAGKVIKDGFELTIDDYSISCSELINCAGLSAQHIAHSIQGIPTGSIPPQYLSRGCYFSLADKNPFSRLIYPLPNEEGLGVHLTLDLAGQARFGPDTEWVGHIDYQFSADRADSFYDAIRSYYPALADGALEPAYAGIRPKVVGSGATAGDFIIDGVTAHGVPGWIALYGIESPGLTACIAIGNYVLALLEQNSA